MDFNWGDDRRPVILSPSEKIEGVEGVTIGDFWSWAYSDTLSNLVRGTLAEYAVGLALGITREPRIDWQGYDLEYDGNLIEVKSAAYVQSWKQDRPSRISFDIERRETHWTKADNKWHNNEKRCADCYVFCLYPEIDDSQLKILDFSLWKFLVMSTKRIEAIFGDQKSVSLNVLRRKCEEIGFRMLKTVVDTELQL